jgi:predicted DsbA family dithiol-disulfide isomerase
VVVDFGEKPELWQKYGVRGTPSLVVEGPTPGSGVFLEGVSQETELEKALLESSRATPQKKAGEGGER